MRQNIVAKAVLFNTDGTVLLIRRSATDHKRPGEWDFPGGEIDAGEDFTAGVQREIREETGIAVEFDTLTLVYAETTVYDDLYVIRLAYAATVDNPKVKLSFEHEEYQWAPQDKVLEIFPHAVYGKGFTNALRYQLIDVKAG